MHQGRWILALPVTLALTLVATRQVTTVEAQDARRHGAGGTALLEDPHLLRDNPDAKRLREQVDAAKTKAFEHGYHACCIKPACSWCLLHLGQCMCGAGVGSGRYACRECHGGWEAGQGVVPGRSKEDVRRMKTIWTDFTAVK